MDARALETVREFLELVQSSRTPGNSSRSSDPEVDEQIKRRLPLIQKIARNVEPGLAVVMHPRSLVGEWQWHNVRDATLALLGHLETAEEADALLRPVGPVLSADGLHSNVWSAAAALWDDGYRRASVQAAAMQVDVLTQAKVGRHDLSGEALQREVWSRDDPTPSRPRLRFPGLPWDSLTERSAHQGAMWFGQGCMAAIRNIATHTADEPDEQVALEYLAALSVLARWVDEAIVVQGVLPPDES